jgi:hypothetical protein
MRRPPSDGEGPSRPCSVLNHDAYLRHLERLATGASGQGVSEPEPERERFTRWLVEHLALGLRDLAKGDHVRAFRSYVAACEYKARLGGFWPDPTVSDAASAVLAELEAVIRGAS